MAGRARGRESNQDRGAGGRGRGQQSGQNQRYDNSGRSSASGSGFSGYNRDGQGRQGQGSSGGSQSYRVQGSGGGGSYRGGGKTVITWSTNRLPLESSPIKKETDWKCPQLPEDPKEIQELIPRRKGSGTVAQRKITAITNHFLVKIQPPKAIFRYDIQMTKLKASRQPKDNGKGKKSPRGAGGDEGSPPPNGVNRDLMKKILRVLVPKIHAEWEAENKGNKISLIHDSSKILFATKQLEPIVGLNYIVLHSKFSHLFQEGQAGHPILEDEDDEDCHYNVTLSPAAFEVDLDRARELLADPSNVDHPDLFEIKQVYNILLKNLGGNRFMPFGRSTILKVPNEALGQDRLGEGLMTWKGISAVCTVGTTWKPFINIDIQNCAVVIGQPVLDAIADILQSNAPRNQRGADPYDISTWSDKDFQNVNNILKSRKVRRWVSGRAMDKPIKTVDYRKARDITFQFENRKISVADYNAQHLNQRLRHPNAPVLELGSPANMDPNKRVFVPAEFCTIKSGQSINRLLPPVATRAMVRQATSSPQEKSADIMRAVADLQMRDNDLFRNFGVVFPDQMHELNGTRVLAPPELCLGPVPNPSEGKANSDRTKLGRVTPVKGEWDIFSTKVEFFKSTKVDAWAILFVGIRDTDPGPFVMQLQDQGENKGMYFEDPIVVRNAQDVRDRGNHNQNVIKICKELNDIKKEFGEREKCFVLCVIPAKGNVLYSQVKQAAERDGNAAVMTQCIVQKNFEYADHSVVKNLLLKINSKLGGINHVPIPPASLGNVDIMKYPTLILGIDVNHPSLPTKGKQMGYPSFAAVTGSLDRSGMPYMMHVKAQIRKIDNKTIGAAEVIQGLEGIVRNMLIKFKAHSGCQPCRIIVYRDGVGDSQFPQILQEEMGAIRKACTSLKESYKPAITFIAVQKRHKVRFFLKENGRIPEKLHGNVPPGTVVDSDICGIGSDFYLLSHAGMLGTSRPTHYHVLWDDSDFTSDEIQGLTYFLCHMYSRCNRSVSYPAPTYYAHFAAFRANNLAVGYQDWDGSRGSLERLNDALQRSALFAGDGTGSRISFPMHFI